MLYAVDSWFLIQLILTLIDSRLVQNVLIDLCPLLTVKKHYIWCVSLRMSYASNGVAVDLFDVCHGLISIIVKQNKRNLMDLGWWCWQKSASLWKMFIMLILGEGSHWNDTRRQCAKHARMLCMCVWVCDRRDRRREIGRERETEDVEVQVVVIYASSIKGKSYTTDAALYPATTDRVAVPVFY